MLSPRSVMALLAVIALSAQVAESAIAAPDKCTAADVGTGFCLTCKTKVKCVEVGAPPAASGTCTTAGEACTVLAGVSSCRPIAETACSCAKSTQCDAYDPDSVLVCLSGGVTTINDCSKKTPAATCNDGKCVAPVTTVATTPSASVCKVTDDGFVLIRPTCTSAEYCLGVSSLGRTNCEPGNYFDVAEEECLPSPPVPCAGCGTGACPDKSDCSKWYICDGGVVLDEETCDEKTPVFDIFAKECLATGTCTGNDGCTYGPTTVSATTPTTVGSISTSSGTGSTVASTSSGTGSTVSSTSSGTGSTAASTSTSTRPATCTAANVGQRYPYAGNCKKYWSCRQLATGVYGYVEATCLGSLVFNANTGYCDTPENVPGCVL